MTKITNKISHLLENPLLLLHSQHHNTGGGATSPSTPLTTAVSTPSTLLTSNVVVERNEFFNVASTDGIRTQHSKVHPSPGAGTARSVWALPLNYDSCNMVAEEDSAAHTDHEVDPRRPHSPHVVSVGGGVNGSLVVANGSSGASGENGGVSGHRGEAVDENLLIFEGADGTVAHLDDIFDIIKNGEVSDVENLTDKFGIECLSARDRHGYTPAHWVALNGNVEMMRYLIERSAPIDLPCLGTQGPRPIHWACRKGHAAVVQVMLQAGVNVNAADFKGLTPLHVACMYGRTATAAYLLGMGALNHLTDINGDTALHWAAYKGHADLMRLLMYSGVELQKTDNFGSTPLHLACLSGNMSCVRLLCEKSNLDLEPRDKNGKTPIMLAQAHQHQDIVRLLYTEVKKKSRWMPSVSEIWGWLFGGAGDSKGPLLLFLFSVLLWGYPMYMIRVSRKLLLSLSNN